jgi:hypothetical protein
MGERILSDLPVLKFDDVGTILKGKFVNAKKSGKFKDSWVLTLDNEGNVFQVFVSEIVYQKLKNNSIEFGEIVKMTYKGMIETKSGREMKDIEIAIID